MNRDTGERAFVPDPGSDTLRPGKQERELRTKRSKPLYRSFPTQPTKDHAVAHENQAPSFRPREAKEGFRTFLLGGGVPLPLSCSFRARTRFLAWFTIVPLIVPSWVEGERLLLAAPTPEQLRFLAWFGPYVTISRFRVVLASGPWSSFSFRVLLPSACPFLEGLPIFLAFVSHGSELGAFFGLSLLSKRFLARSSFRTVALTACRRGF